MLDTYHSLNSVYVSSVCKSICDKEYSNMVNTHVYVKCENTQKMPKLGSRNQFDKWSRQDKNARYSGLSGFSMCIKCV